MSPQETELYRELVFQIALHALVAGASRGIGLGCAVAKSQEAGE
jgi:hypothetical protein